MLWIKNLELSPLLSTEVRRGGVIKGSGCEWLFQVLDSGYGRVCVLSRFIRVRLSVTLWTVALQAPLSMRFSWQQRWSGCPDTATLLLLCAGHRLSSAQGCQIHFDFGLDWGFMLSEKFPPLPFT